MISPYFNFWVKELFKLWIFCAGYEHQIPIDSMQGLDIGSQGGSQYGGMENLPDLGPNAQSGDLNFENLESSLPQQSSNSQAMPWFDTDL